MSEGGELDKNEHGVNFGAVKRLYDTLSATDGKVSLQSVCTLEVPMEL